METGEMVIVIDPNKCTGCHGCEMACSMEHYGMTSTSLSRIRITEFREVNTFIPITCQACEDGLCIKVCPMGARRRSASGAVVTNEEACIGCMACIYACPFGAPVVDPQSGKTMSCDQCVDEEQPWCVRACVMQEALTYVPKCRASAVKARSFAWTLKEQYEPKGAKDDGGSGFSFA
jgi:carbon-monoxide dehydrogenase iron sulfur subunit